MAEAPQPSALGTETTLPLETIDYLDRLGIIREQAGFLPTTRGELNEAFGLLSFMDGPGGAAKHLAEISIHQTKYGADPTRAVRSVTNEYVGYASRARTDLTMLSTLQEEAKDRAATHPFEAVRGDSLYTGKGQLVRFLDLSDLASGKDMSSLDIKPLRGYSKPKRDAYDPYITAELPREMSRHIDQKLNGIRNWQLERVVDAAMADQRERFKFWTDRLMESRQHMVARPLAYAALQKFGIIKH